MSDLHLDHVAVAVPDLGGASRLFELLTGETCSALEEIPSQGVNVAFVGAVELLEPRSADTPVGRFLERRGPGLHHIAYRVADIRSEMDRLQAAGIELIDPRPRPGARGHQVAFLHPRGTGGVLIELVQEA